MWSLGGPGCAESWAASSFMRGLLGNEGAVHQGWEKTRISAEALKGLGDKFGMVTVYETLDARIESGCALIMSCEQETF